LQPTGLVVNTVVMLLASLLLEPLVS